MPGQRSNKKPSHTFITSNKGKNLLVIDDYIYEQNKVTPNVTYWVCKIKDCNARAHTKTNTGELIKQTGDDHCHLPSPEEVEVRSFKNIVKARVKQETLPIGQIYEEELGRAKLSATALVQVPTANKARAGLNIFRRQNFPVLPTTTDFDIPKRFSHTTDGQSFIVADRISGWDKNKRMIVFGTEQQLSFLFTCSHIMIDGTYKSCPKFFKQVFSIHGMKYHQSFLCAIALMGDKSSAMYKDLFFVLDRYATRLQQNFCPTRITSDYESGLVKVIAEVFPNAHHSGCWFHYTQAIHRQIQTLGLTKFYRDDPNARSAARKLMVLALLPLNQVELAFNDVATDSPSCIQQLLNYFKTYWMTKVKLSFWNVAELEIRTNNNVEDYLTLPICDGFTELTPIIIDGRNETDETECEYWQCNNTYTRCNGIWNCLNGADEVDCNSSSSLLNCSSHHHLCVSLNTSQLVCLPLEKANDGNIDCVGGTDEPKLCRSNNYIPADKGYYCNTDQNEDCISFGDLYCSSNCKSRSNGQFCDRFFDDMPDYELCDKDYETIRSDVENFFCTRQNDIKKEKIINFSLDKSTKSTQQHTNAMISYSSIRQTTIDQFQQLCHRGLSLHVWLDDQQNLSTIGCLCPPSFYGDMCQYQNQRVSLTMRFETFSDSRRTLFALIVSLIDDSNERIIHSYQQFTYLYIRDCQKKFNIYLLYSTRPKHLGKNYSLHIDIYDKMLLKYRGSILIPLEFSFLSVHRIAVHLTIPRTSDRKESCLDQQCIHGQCIRYSYNQNPISFCQCYQGWFGKYCTIPYKCICSPDLLCVGISSNNRSICVCPLNKWGSQCYLHNTICNFDNNVTCYNNGQCVPIDENIASTKQFVCICRKGFGGERCEIVYKKTIFSFHEDINLPEKVFIHFIRLFDNAPPENDSTFTTIRVNQNSINIQWPRPFHIEFLKIFRNYYLITVQKIYNQSTTINRKITLSDRCKHLNEILNETIVNLHLLRRIKYYHLACQKHSPPLLCFYDNTYFCLCTDYGNQRLANCFEFNSSIEHNCFGQSNCENGAQCLQDRISCPQTSICICSKCFHGTRCQFSSNLLDLSFDAILGYHIQLHTNIKHQPSIIQFSVALTTIMILVGLINSILSIITFKSEEMRKIGCGIYLLTSSIISFITFEETTRGDKKLFGRVYDG